VVVPLAMLALALQVPPTAPELQVEATTASGAAAPEFGAAVSQALVVTGAIVILGRRAGEPCARCVRLDVREQAPGRYGIEVRQAQHVARGTIEVSHDAPVFERACAVAIQARLLIDWKTDEEESNGSEPMRATLAAPRTARPPAAQPAARAGAARILKSAAALDLAPTQMAPPPDPTSGPAMPSSRAPAPPDDAPAPLAAGALANRTGDGGAKVWPWVPTAVGAAAALASAGFGVAANRRYAALSDRSLSLGSALATRDEGKKLQTASLALAGVAAAGLAVGIAGFLLSPRPAQASLGVAPVRGGAMVAVTGSLP